MMNAKRAGIAVGAALLLPALATASSAAAASATASAPASAPASAAAVPPPRGVTMAVVTVNGSGCPPGTAKVTPSHGNAAFTVTYDSYVAWAGGAAPPTDFRKNCQLNVRVDAPDDYTYAVIGITHRGFGHLKSEVTGMKRTNYYFQGDSRSQSVTHTLNGPYNKSWRFADRTDPDERIYKPCGKDRNLNINSELRVTPGGSETSFMAMESENANAIYHLAWKRCSD